MNNFNLCKQRAAKNRRAPGRQHACAAFVALFPLIVAIATSPESVAQATPRSSVIYINDFERGVGPGWTPGQIEVPPFETGQFLGQFADETVRLTLTNLPQHTAISVAFDLHLIGSWDGNGEYCCGPDLWGLRLSQGPDLVRDTFSNFSGEDGGPIQTQTYPRPQAGLRVPPQTGARDIASLGYYFPYPWGYLPADSTYRLAVTFAHTATTNLTLEFFSQGSQTPDDESWGLDNVVVTAINAPAGTVEFDALAYVVGENETNLVATVTRVGGAAGSVTVDYQTQNGTARSGVDFRAASGQLTFEDGEVMKTLVIPMFDDTAPEDDELFELTLTNPGGGATLGSRAQATVHLFDDDHFAEFAIVDESSTEIAGFAFLLVRRVGAINRPQTVTYSTRGGTATPDVDFLSDSDQVSFAPGDLEQFISIAIEDDAVREEEESFSVVLSSGLGSSLIGPQSTATVAILDNDEPGNPGRGVDWEVSSAALQDDGKIIIAGRFSWVDGTDRSGIARVESHGIIDPSLDPGAGANAPVETVLIQPDQKIVVAGSFSSFRGVSRASVARLLPTGVIDATFNPRAGPDGFLMSMALQPDGKLMVGGSFLSFAGAQRAGICRLNANGSVDLTFRSGTGNLTDYVRAIAIQVDRKILVAGDFLYFGNQFYDGVVRLNSDGTLDRQFNTGSGTAGLVFCLAVQSDDKILIGGTFSSVDGVTRSGIARLNPSGTLDNSFRPVPGTDDFVQTIALQSDGKIIVGGEFLRVNGVRRSRIARLNSDGSLDPTFDPGEGANATIRSITLLTNDHLFVTGEFTAWGNSPRYRTARLNGDGKLLPIGPDTTAPVLSAAGSYGSANTIILSFSEQIDPRTVSDLTNYALQPSIGIATATSNPEHANQIILTTTAPLNPQTSYTLNIKGVSDLSGNSIESIAPIDTELALPVDIGESVKGFQDDFNTASRDPNWVPRSGADPGIGTDIYTQTNGVLTVRTVSNDPNHLLYEAPGYDPAVQEVLARVRVLKFSIADGSRAGIATAVGFATNHLAEQSGHFGIDYHFRSSDWNLGGEPIDQTQFLYDWFSWGPGFRTTWQTNVWYWMRLRHEPNRRADEPDAFAKFWPADGSTPEPLFWQTWDYHPFFPKSEGFAGIVAGSFGHNSDFEVDYILIKAQGLPTIQVAPAAFPVPVRPSIAIRLDPGASQPIRLQILNPPRPLFIIQASTDLLNWLPVFTNTAPANQLEWLDPNANLSTTRFYRVLFAQPPESTAP